ncbi:hypothetical protein CF326_g8956 [Tilletia indica]|nr:hypothetical protein CF326_g8956 [Tilletia indica]
MSAELYLSPLDSTFHFAPKTFLFDDPATLTLDGHISGMCSSSAPTPENAFFPSVALAIDQAFIHYDGASFTLKSVDYHSDPVCVNGMLLGNRVHTLSDGDRLTFGRYQKQDHCFEVDCGVIVRFILPAPRTTNWPGIRQLLEHLRCAPAQDIQGERSSCRDQASTPRSGRSQTSGLASVPKPDIPFPSSTDPFPPPRSRQPTPPSTASAMSLPPPICTPYGDSVQETRLDSPHAATSASSTSAPDDRRPDPSTNVPCVSNRNVPSTSVTSPSCSAAAKATSICTGSLPFGSVAIQSDSCSMSTADVALSRVAAAWAAARRWMGLSVGPPRFDPAPCSVHWSSFSKGSHQTSIALLSQCPTSLGTCDDLLSSPCTCPSTL